MKKMWSAEEKAIVAEKLRDKLSATQIAPFLGVTRNSIIGVVHRHKELRDIGFQSQTKKGGSKTGGQRKAKRNVIRFPVKFQLPKPVLVTDAVPTPMTPQIRVVANNTQMMVADYLAKHGARRFNRGETVDYSTLQIWLAPRGYTLSVHRSQYKLAVGAGKLKPVQWREVIRFVDRLRVAEGLQPILRALDRRQAAAGE